MLKCAGARRGLEIGEVAALVSFTVGMTLLPNSALPFGMQRGGVDLQEIPNSARASPLPFRGTTAHHLAELATEEIKAAIAVFLGNLTDIQSRFAEALSS